MTVEAQNIDGSPIVSSGPYLGNGVTTAFSYEFPITRETEIKVTRQNADLTEDVLALTTDYTVAGVGNSGGGTISLVSAALAPAGSKLVLQLDMAFDQQTDYSNQGRIKLELLETSLDSLVLMCRQLKEQVSRAVLVGSFSAEDPSTVIPQVFAAALAAETAAIEAEASAAEALAKENSMLRDRGSWATATLYSPSDIFTVAPGTSYITQVAHTSTNIAADLAANRIRVFAAQGPSGPGSGDMLKAENLSGLTDIPTARANISAQQSSTKLTELAAPAYVRGDVIRRDSTGLNRLALGANGRVLRSDGTDVEWGMEGFAYIADGTRVGSNSTSAQTILGVGITLPSNFAFEYTLGLRATKSAGTTLHDFQVNFNGSAVITGACRHAMYYDATSAETRVSHGDAMSDLLGPAGINTASRFINYVERGVVEIGAGGTLHPRYNLSAAPGGAYTIAQRAYMTIRPLVSYTSGVLNEGPWA